MERWLSFRASEFAIRSNVDDALIDGTARKPAGRWQGAVMDGDHVALASFGVLVNTLHLEEGV